ncbi:MAG: hypothetical protein IID44_30010 [Planctomycetes bacterium]|nr:hypothetical protein [Planctomycetota bacterium]
MNRQQFQEAVAGNAHLSGPIERAARAGRPQQFSVVTEAAIVALMFPLANYVLTQIGLPWLYELKRYSELQRQKLHDWIDAKYREEGFDPDAAEAAGNALLEELEQTTDEAARGAWQRLTQLMTDSE